MNKTDQKFNKDLETKLIKEIEEIIYKIDNSIKVFKFNVSIANFYESYSLINKYLKEPIRKSCLIECITKIMKLILPFTPFS